MSITHIYTTNGSDEFLLNAFDMFRDLKIFDPKDYSRGYDVKKHYDIQELDSLTTKTDENLTDKIIDSEEIKLEVGKERPLPENERSETLVVIVNAQLDFEEISTMYPKAIIAGYATNEKEAADIRAASGIEDAFIFRYGKENQPDKFLKYVVKWNFAVSDLRNSGLGGILTDDSYKSVLAQGVRRWILTPFEMCGSCSFMFDYRKVQNHFLRMGKEGSKKLFRYSQIFNEKYKDYPILRTIKRCKESKDCKSGPHGRALRRFIWDYKHWSKLQKLPKPLRWTIKKIPFEWILR